MGTNAPHEIAPHEIAKVPFADADELQQAGGFVQLQPLPGLGHRRILYAPSTVEAAVAFIQST